MFSSRMPPVTFVVFFGMPGNFYVVFSCISYCDYCINFCYVCAATVVSFQFFWGGALQQHCNAALTSSMTHCGGFQPTNDFLQPCSFPPKTVYAQHFSREVAKDSVRANGNCGYTPGCPIGMQRYQIGQRTTESDHPAFLRVVCLVKIH